MGILWCPDVYYDEIKIAIDNARTFGRGGKGSIVVFAAGNNRNNNGCNKYTSDGPDGYIGFPGTVPGVICVGAINKSGNLSSFSSYGPRIDVVAFGGEISPNADIRTIDRMGGYGYNTAIDGNYNASFNGTSAACPQVAGVAALMLSVNPSLTEAQVTDLIKASATDIGASGKDNYFGYGRLDAFKSVSEAYRIGNPSINYFQKGQATKTKIASNESRFFLNSPVSGQGPGMYYCDVYKVEATISKSGFTSFYSTYCGYAGYGNYTENIPEYYLAESDAGNTKTYTTYFYYLKSVSGNPVNKWAPFNPDENTGAKEYTVMGYIPPLTVSITGPSSVAQNSYASWSVSTSGGTGTYSYAWYKQGAYVGNGSSITLLVDDVFTLRLVLTRGTETVEATKQVYPDAGGGGCPFLFVKTKSGYEMDNNILHRSEFAEFAHKDITDIYKLNLIPQKEGNRYHVSLKEVGNDYSYIDQVRLYTVDHPSGTELGITENNDLVLYRLQNIASADYVSIYDQDLSNYLRFDPKGYGLSGSKGQVLNMSFSHPFHYESEFYQFKDYLSNGQYKDSTFIMINPGVAPNAPPKEFAATITFSADPTQNKRFARRERNSVVFIPINDRLLSADISFDWNRDFYISYVGLTKALYGGYLKNEVPLLSADYSSGNSAKRLLQSVDTKYAELDSTESIDLSYGTGDVIPTGWVRDFVIEVVGHYELPDAGILFKADPKLKKSQLDQSVTKNPVVFELSNNYPNPFNPTTTIRFALPQAVQVSLKIYDILGREVIELVNENKPAGVYEVNFDASKLASGTYIYRLRAGNYIESKKMILLK